MNRSAERCILEWLGNHESDLLKGPLSLSAAYELCKQELKLAGVKVTPFARLTRYARTCGAIRRWHGQPGRQSITPENGYLFTELGEPAV